MVMLHYRLQSWPNEDTAAAATTASWCHIRVPARNLIISTTVAFRVDATSGPAMPPCHPATLLPPAFILATKEPEKWLLLLPSWEGRIHSVCMWVWVCVGVLSHQEGVEEVPTRQTN